MLCSLRLSESHLHLGWQPDLRVGEAGGLLAEGAPRTAQAAPAPGAPHGPSAYLRAARAPLSPTVLKSQVFENRGASLLWFWGIPEVYLEGLSQVLMDIRELADQ